MTDESNDAQPLSWIRRRTQRTTVTVWAALLLALGGLVGMPVSNASAATVDTYASYAALVADPGQTLGTDYRIRYTNAGCPILVIAIHGGGIETGTSELARAIAGEGEEQIGPHVAWSSYRFEGLKLSGNSVLHITATNFDEPTAVGAVHYAVQVVSVHGAPGSTPVTYVGGLDTFMRDRVIAALVAAGFSAEVAPAEYGGDVPTNVVNRGLTLAGVQLEVSTAQRVAFWGTNSAAQRWNTRNALFHAYVAAVRSAVAMPSVSLG